MTEPPHYVDESVTLFHGDCLDVLAGMPDSSVDAIVTDPPYGIGFMGREWDQPGEYGSSRRGGTDRPFTAGAVGVDHRTTTERSASMHAGKYDLSPSTMRAFQSWCEEWARECLRVLKPGGHLLAFGGARTWHRLVCAVEDAGFEVRDSIAWLYGSGFPKSLDVAKAVDRLDATDERRARALEFTAWMRSTGITLPQINDATGTRMGSHYLTDAEQPAVATADLFDRLRPLLPDVPERIERLVEQRTVESANYAARRVVGERSTGIGTGAGAVPYIGDGDRRITAPHTPDAAAWQGWGTALKPAFEPIVVARKPLAGTVAANVLAHGTGALNIDGCRVNPGTPVGGGGNGAANVGGIMGPKTGERSRVESHTAGRWPTNVVLDGSQADALDEQSGTLTSGANPIRRGSDKFRDAYGEFRGQQECTPARGADTGGASRFFPTFRYEAKAPTVERPRDGNAAHPTVKPLDLMRWLVRLVTPPGGIVLDPFAGSGTTGEACVIEGVRAILVEREAAYLPLIVARLSKPIQPDLFGIVADDAPVPEWPR